MCFVLYCQEMPPPPKVVQPSPPFSRLGPYGFPMGVVAWVAKKLCLRRMLWNRRRRFDAWVPLGFHERGRLGCQEVMPPPYVVGPSPPFSRLSSYGFSWSWSPGLRGNYASAERCETVSAVFAPGFLWVPMGVVAWVARKLRLRRTLWNHRRRFRA